jgi:RNA-directed DNA polymerase
MADEWIVQELNLFLRGWGGYFRYGNSARVFDAISQYALERLAGFVGKRHKRSLRWGMRLVTCGSPDNLGLIIWSENQTSAGRAFRADGGLCRRLPGVWAQWVSWRCG